MRPLTSTDQSPSSCCKYIYILLYLRCPNQPTWNFACPSRPLWRPPDAFPSLWTTPLHLRILRAVQPQLCIPFRLCRPSLRIWTKLFHQTHYLPQVLHHISDVVTAAVIISLTVFHRNYGFSSNQVKPLYFYGPYLGVSRPPSWFNYADELKQSLRVFQVSFPYGLPSTTSLLSYIPELTLNKLQEYLRSSTWNFLHNMPNPNSYLLFIAGQTFTSIVDLL